MLSFHGVPIESSVSMSLKDRLLTAGMRPKIRDAINTVEDFSVFINSSPFDFILRQLANGC